METRFKEKGTLLQKKKEKKKKMTATSKEVQPQPPAMQFALNISDPLHWPQQTPQLFQEAADKLKPLIKV